MSTPAAADPVRERILDAGAHAFATTGYQQATLRDIAAAAGVGEPELLQQFASKTALHLAIAQAARDELLVRGGRAMAAGGSLEQRLKAAWDAFFRFVEERPHRARAILIVPLDAGELQDGMLAIQDQATQRLAQLLIAEPGVLPGDAQRQARLPIAMEFIRSGMHGLARWWLRHPEVPRSAITDAIELAAWRGILGMHAS